ncbi:MAG: ATP-binding protein [Bacillota bacterium]
MASIDVPITYNQPPDHQEELANRIEGWVKVRFIIAYLLFISIFLYRPSLSLPYPIVPLLATLLLVIIFNCSSLLILSYRRKWITKLAYAQVGADLLVISIVYQITGGVDSPFDWLYLYVVIAAGLVGGLRFSLLSSLVNLITSAFVLIAQYYFFLPHYHVGILATHSLSGFHDAKLIMSKMISNSVMFISLGLISGYVANLAEQRRLKLAEAYQFLKHHNENVLEAITVTQEKERKRIARELHDQTGQTLTVLITGLRMLETKLNTPKENAVQLASLGELAENLLDEVHNVIFDLRPSVLDDIGVIASIRWYMRTYIEPLGINTEILITGENRRLDENREIVLYRFLQEAISNVIKHAEAREIVIIFHFKPDTLQVEVSDNGVGFDVTRFTDSTQRWGIVGMKERIDMLHGEFSIKTEPGIGTCLSVVLPLEPGLRMVPGGLPLRQGSF